MFAKFAYDPGEMLLGDLDVELALLAGVVLVHARTITA